MVDSVSNASMQPTLHDLIFLSDLAIDLNISSSANIL